MALREANITKQEALEHGPAILDILRFHQVYVFFYVYIVRVCFLMCILCVCGFHQLLCLFFFMRILCMSGFHQLLCVFVFICLL